MGFCKECTKELIGWWIFSTCDQSLQILAVHLARLCITEHTGGVLNNIYVGDIYVHRSFAVTDIIKDPNAV